MIRNLADLVHPTPEANFLNQFERKKFMRMKGERDKIASLLSLDDINRVLNTGLLSPPDIRLYRSGKEIPEIMYYSKQNGLSVAAVHDILRRGASLVMDNIAPRVPRLARLEQAIERRLQAVTSINAYLGFNRGSAFAPHYDNHEVLVVQVLGQKHWQLLGQAEPSSISVRPCRPPLACSKEATWQHTLCQGELLYVPRGTWHRATLDEGGISLHLTITIVRSNGLDYAKWLLDQLKTDDFFAQDLPHLGKKSVLHKHEAALQTRIGAMMKDLGVKRFLSARDGDRPVNAQFQLGRTRQPEAEDVLISTLRRPLAAEGGDPTASIDIRLNGQSHRLSPPMYAALREIDQSLDGLRHDVLLSRLVDSWTNEEIRAAISRLAAKGLVAIAACPPQP